jgi:hypothetical protein
MSEFVAGNARGERQDAAGAAEEAGGHAFAHEGAWARRWARQRARPWAKGLGVALGQRIEGEMRWVGEALRSRPQHR